MLIYIILIIFSTFIFITHIYIKKESINNMTALLWVLIMSFFVGFQDSLGNDYATYIEICKNEWFYIKEPFTKLVLFPIRQMSFPPLFFFWIYAFLTYYFYVKFVMLHPRGIRFLMIMIIFPFVMFFQSFNLIRQILACSVFLYGAELLFRSKKKAWIYIIGSSLIHQTALFSIPLLFIAKFYKSTCKLFIIYIVSFLIFATDIININSFILILQWFISRTSYVDYLDSDLIYENNNSSIGLIYILLFFASILIYIKRNKIYMLGYKSQLNIFYIGQSFYFLFMLNPTLLRVSYYCYFYLFLLVPLLVLLSKSIQQRTRIALIIYCMLFFLYYKILSAPNMPFIPYKTIL